MLCNNCKKVIVDDSKLCPFCGKPIATSNVGVPEQGNGNGLLTDVNNTVGDKMTTYDNTRERKLHKLLANLVILVVAVVILIQGTIRAFSIKKRVIGEWCSEVVEHIDGKDKVKERVVLNLKSNGKIIYIYENKELESLGMGEHRSKDRGTWHVNGEKELVVKWNDNFLDKDYYEYSKDAMDPSLYDIFHLYYFCPVLSNELYWCGDSFSPVNPILWGIQRFVMLAVGVILTLVFLIRTLVSWKRYSKR